MKAFFTAAFILLSTSCFAQKTPHLKGVKSSTGLGPGQAIIYGSFIQRLGFWKTGYEQDIRIRNIATNELFTFDVKPYLRSRKENPFCFYIKPGTYDIVSYFYSISKWYGLEYRIVPIYRNIDPEVNLRNKIDSGLMKYKDLHRIIFKVDSNTVSYLGRWHFEGGPASFTTAKDSLDSKLQPEYVIKFSTAVTVIPN